MAKKLSEVKPTDEVVVKLGAKQDTKNGKVVTIEHERQVTMTKAGFDAIQFDDEDSEFAVTLGRTVTLLGIPKYKKETNSMAGTIQELEKVEEFAKEAALPEA